MKTEKVISFYDKLITKLLNDYHYYTSISIVGSNESAAKYLDRADEIMSIIEWCKYNYEEDCKNIN